MQRTVHRQSPFASLVVIRPVGVVLREAGMDEDAGVQKALMDAALVNSRCEEYDVQ